jgi:uncharacterized membrane protein YiaA
MFRMLGIVVLLYVAYALVTGEVYAKSGWRGRSVYRRDERGYFIAVIVTYTLLGVALITVF